MLVGDTNETYKISDELWERIEPLLPPEIVESGGGHLRTDDRKVMEAIFYVFRNCSEWKALPRSFGDPTTIYNRFQEWREAGVFQRMWREGLLEYDELRAIFWYGRRKRMREGRR